MKLIDKSALVAEIKKLLAFYLKEVEDNKEDPWATDIAKRDILQEILSFINTLEVKEVNLEEESKKYSSCIYLEEVLSDDDKEVLRERLINTFKAGAQW